MNAALLLDPETGYLRSIDMLAEAHADEAFAVIAPSLSTDLGEKETQDQGLILVEPAGQCFSCEIYVASLSFGATAEVAESVSRGAIGVFMRRFREQVSDWQRGGRA